MHYFGLSIANHCDTAYRNDGGGDRRTAMSAVQTSPKGNGGLVGTYLEELGRSSLFDAILGTL